MMPEKDLRRMQELWDDEARHKRIRALRANARALADEGRSRAFPALIGIAGLVGLWLVTPA